jgi:hypothetical protein
MGLLAITETIALIWKICNFKYSVEMVSKLPFELSRPPYKGVIWNDVRGVMQNKGKPLARDIMLYMLGHYRKPLNNLKARYAKSLEKPEDEVQLPKTIIVTSEKI